MMDNSKQTTDDPADSAASRPSTAGGGGNEPPDPPMAEGPDQDPAAWEGDRPEDAVGLVDPRHEIPNPPGL